ncbi:KPNB1 [Scenedesmus sp. PABB004]|nr:KPNB1 [Scenedesmus sp. PABB004]
MASTPVEVTQLLLHAQDPDANVRSLAEQKIAQFQEHDYPGFLASLAAELSSTSKPADSRRLAGLVLKNTLDAKDEARKAELQARWGAVDAGLKTQIRDALLSTLQMEPQDVRHTAALVIAKVAAIDLPRREWPGLIAALLANMSAQPPHHGVRQATLEVLGYVCEEMGAVSEEVLSPEQINMILTAVVAGMRPDEPSDDARLAATTALQNAIEFAEHNFENEQERTYIMQMVCQGTSARDERIRIASFTCLHEIATNYYATLPPYMTEIFNISVKAVQEDSEDVGLQAVEFWSTLCDIELDLADEDDPTEVNHHFIAAVVPHLVPVLLKQLTKQEEGQEQDDTAWNLAMASGTCLGLLARTAQDAIVPHVMPFVTENIGKNGGPDDWRLREAATFAFGSILEGPSPRCLADIVRQAMGFLLAAMKDPHPYVRDTTAWTIGRVFEFQHDAGNSDVPELITRETLPQVAQVLVGGLGDSVHIAVRVCDAVGRLAEGFAGYPGQSSPLSPFFKEIITVLLSTAQRSDPSAVDSTRLAISAFEAINDMVRAASPDTLDTVGQLTPVFLAEINKTFAMPAGSGELREKQAELQGQLCGVLQVIMQKLSEVEQYKAAVLQYADQIMETLLRVFSGQAGQASVHEEAMLAVGAFTYACGRAFAKYLPAFYPFLKMGLMNHAEWQVCLSTVGVLGDVARNVESDLLPYCDEIMQLLIHNLSSNDVHRSIKPQILSTFGDLALVLGDAYEKYLDTVKRMLAQAMHLSVMQAQASADDDFLDYNNELRIGILEAYSGIFQGLGSGKAEAYMKGEVPLIVEFANSIGRDATPDDTVVRNCVNLLGDIATVVPGVGPLLQASSSKDWEKLLAYCHDSGHLLGDTEWAINAVSAAVQQGGAAS